MNDSILINLTRKEVFALQNLLADFPHPTWKKIKKKFDKAMKNESWVNRFGEASPFLSMLDELDIKTVKKTKKRG